MSKKLVPLFLFLVCTLCGNSKTDAQSADLIPLNSKADGQQENLIRNGDFSKGNVEFYSDYNYSTEPLLNETKYTVGANAHDAFVFFGACRDRSLKGNMMIVNGATTKNKIVWQQTVHVQPQTLYSLSMWVCTVNVKRKEEQTTHPAVLQVYINKQAVGLVYTAEESTCRWKELSASWFSGLVDTASISLVDLNILPNGNDFGLDDILLKEDTAEDLSIELERLKVGEPLAVKNILFETGKVTIKNESLIALDKVVAFLKKHPSLKLEISGHTDDTGSASENILLSVNRAKEIGKYCISKGIASFRISAKGYGSSRPMDTNATAFGRENNRRVEFVLSK